MGLNAYLQQTQRFLSDATQQRYNPFDLKVFVNQARKWIASESQCLRVKPPSTGSVLTLTLTNAGSGYSANPTVTIGAPDQPGGIPATAVAVADDLIFVGTGPISWTGMGGAPLTFGTGTILSLSLTNAGSGYTVAPTVTITGGGGSGATAVATITPFNATVAGREVYPFSDVNTVIRYYYPGVESIIAVQSIAVSWGAMKPVLRKSDWTTLQAYYRSYNIGYQNYPTIWAQYNQGADGSAYVWPVPALVTPMDWDCYCLPLDLDEDDDTEALPYPWTDAVPYYAVYLALLSDARGERRDDANYFLAEYRRLMAQSRSYVTVATAPDMYPDN